jgi:hypothetical protein
MNGNTSTYFMVLSLVFVIAFRVKLKQGNGRNRLIYSGIATGRNCNSFWPMIPGDKEYPTVRNIVINMQSGEPMPPNGCNKFDIKFMFPNMIEMRFFEQPRLRLPTGKSIPDRPNYPKTEEELEDNWNEISKQYIFMYPGGAGMRVEQFLMIPDFTLVKKRIESPILPYWFPDKYSGFIPDIQGGWTGPVVSYYKRIDSNYRSYW